jgi:hypothetical protein
VTARFRRSPATTANSSGALAVAVARSVASRDVVDEVVQLVPFVD